MKPSRLVSWDSMLLRISGEQIAQRAGAEIGRRNVPLKTLDLTFRDGELIVEGAVQKLIPVPFRMVIREIEPDGTRIRVRLAEASAFGFLPIPQLAIEIVGKKFSSDEVSFDPVSNAFVITLDRFLPPFVDVRVDQIDVVSGGIRIKLGPGGADPPQ